MSQTFDRRSLLVTAGAGAVTLLGACATQPQRKVAPRATGRKLRHGAIACGGMGFSDLRALASHSEIEVVALCDVDTARIEGARKFGTGAREFQDWRVMLDEMAGEMDSVHVSTPDHMHAAIAMAAMARGLHVYCQKPLTKTVAEARAMRRMAEETGVVTQMGIQNHSNQNYARALALFKQDLIGKIHEVHVWSDRPAGWWPQGVERPEGSDPIPETLDWDAWLGVAPERPFKAGEYHPFKWRGREDFGTGAQGDMACHLMDPVPWFLGLDSPLTIRSDGPAPNGESFPLWSRVHYTFAPNRLTTRGPLPVTWHDGGMLPPEDLLASLGTDRASLPKNACLFVGTKGALIANPYGEPQLLPAEGYAEVELPDVKGTNHWHQWIDACRGEGEASAPFDYAAKLTEVALLGNIALRFPHETLTYDGDAMRFPDRPEADPFLYPNERAGWKIEGLGA